MVQRQKSFVSRLIGEGLVIPARTSFLMWLAFYLEFSGGYALSNYGVVPRTLLGLVGIAAAPLLHGNVAHILANTFPLIVLGALSFALFPARARWVFNLGYVVPPAVTWLIGSSNTVHIGASGLIYCLAGYLVLRGVLSRSVLAWLTALAVTVAYGSLIFGLVPGRASVSWEMHLSGFALGIGLAWLHRKTPQKNPAAYETGG